MTQVETSKSCIADTVRRRTVERPPAADVGGPVRSSHVGIEIVCAVCGTDDHLRGTPIDGGLIELTCGACGTTSTRDPRPSCPTCGGHDMEAMPQVIVEKSRGTQMSIQGVHREFVCRVCDADRIAVKRDVHLPRRLPGSQ
jgi:hypothetical protein